MGIAQKQAVICPNCSKRYAVKPELAGKRVKCKCGGVMPVPVFDAGDSPDDLYDLAPDAAPAGLTTPTAGSSNHSTAPANGPPAGLSPRQVSINADEVLARLGKMPAKPPIAEQLAEQARQKARSNPALQESIFRDVYVPIAIIIAGIVLSFVEAMTVGTVKTPAAKTLLDAVPLVAMRVGLVATLTIGGMALAAAIAEVCFIGSFKGSILRFIAIGVGPASLYSLLTFEVGGYLAGPVIGVFVSLITYWLLFYCLMKLDLADTSVCVVIVWILITAANYAAFKAEAAMSGSWL